MVKKDLIIGLTGTLILVTAMIGVFRFEAAQAGSSFDVAWPTITTAGPGAEDRTVEGSETEILLNLTSTNVTRLVFALAWTDDVPDSGPDRFSLRVTAPGGKNYTADPSSTGTVELVVDDLVPVPEGIRLAARSAEDAEATLAPRYTTTGATGVWTVTVVMVEAQDQSVPVAGVPVTEDNGNDWTLTTQVTTYAALATPA